MNVSTLHEILSKVRYKDWRFEVVTKWRYLFLRVRFTDIEGRQWTGRKWYISKHSTQSEVIQTAFKAVLTAEEHEIRERFLVHGYAIYGPHIRFDVLLAAVASSQPDARLSGLTVEADGV